ncbi:UNVERIFIED_CONTAM: exopolysaccharide biosynthesis protein [Brevibacillus sp. OAP136]
MRTKWQIVKRLLFATCCFGLYFVLSTAAISLYGPFENIRSTIVGMVLTSRHPFVITPFFSKETLAKYQPVGLDQMDRGTDTAGNFSNISDEGIEEIPIKTSKFTGTMLVVKDPKRVHVGVTKHLNHVGQTVSEMVKDTNAVAGVNAGGFFDKEGLGTGGTPMGLTISRGSYVSGDKKALQPVIGITNKGALVVGKYTYEELERMGIKDAISFGPELVKDGKPYLKESSGSWGIAPRTAIGQREDGAILLLAISGRGNNGIGATLLDIQNVMLDQGAVIAANLDGGYSTELYYQGKFLVPPSNPLGERYVATSFLVDGVKKQ